MFVILKYLQVHGISCIHNEADISFHEMHNSSVDLEERKQFICIILWNKLYTSIRYRRNK